MADVYLLKDGALYNLSSGSSLPLNIDEVHDGDYQLFIDDAYFFYVQVGKLNLSRKKVRPVVENYLQSVFPLELFSGFALFENKNEFTALVYRDTLSTLLEQHKSFFCGAKKISTAFCELSIRYNDFIFYDGAKTYMKKGSMLEVLAETSNEAIKASDLWDELIPLKTSIDIPGIKKEKAPVNNYVSAAIVIGVCYIFFLMAQVVSVMADKKVENQLNARLTKYYEQLKVDDKADPYGTLISMAQRQVIAPFRILNLLNDLGNSVPKTIQIESLSVNERLARVEGYGRDFAAIEELKKSLDIKLKKQTTLEESRQIDDRVKFVIRYEP